METDYAVVSINTERIIFSDIEGLRHMLVFDDKVSAQKMADKMNAACSQQFYKVVEVTVEIN